MKVQLSGVSIGQKEHEYVNSVLKSGILSIGKYTEAFEKKVADFSKRKYGIAVSSGTAGLFLLLKEYELKATDEVMTSPFSFIASANVIEHAGGRAVFADIEKKSLCISAEDMEIRIKNDYEYTNKKLINRKNGNRLRGFLPVDIFGNIPDYKKILSIAEEFNLFVIEDSCESFGSFKGKHPAGSFGQSAVFAFYPNKQITTGEGGMIVTDSKKTYDYMRALRNQGRKDMDLWLEHSYLGYNFRINELSSALGLAQMERVCEILEKRDRVADYYNEKLSKIDQVTIPDSSSVDINGWFVYVIRVDEKKRNSLMNHLIKNSISVRPYFTPIHTQPYYKKKYGYSSKDFPVTFDVSKKTIAIPFHTQLKREEQDYVIEKIKGFFNG